MKLKNNDVVVVIRDPGYYDHPLGMVGHIVYDSQYCEIIEKRLKMLVVSDMAGRERATLKSHLRKANAFERVLYNIRKSLWRVFGW